MGIHFQRRAARQRHFTLIELLAAMAVLVLLMFTLFRFFGSAQKAWSISESNTRIYENARIAFEVITRDLQSAVASSHDGQKIPFYVWPAAGGSSGERLSFVARVDTNEKAEADLCELVYAWKADATDNYWLRRARDCDKDSSGAKNDNWDFYGKTDASWTTTHAALQKVIPGVTNLSFTCLDRDGDDMTTAAYLSKPNPYNKLPASVLVSLTVVDEKLVNAPDPVKNKTKRTFTKTIFLGSRE